MYLFCGPLNALVFDVAATGVPSAIISSRRLVALVAASSTGLPALLRSMVETLGLHENSFSVVWKPSCNTVHQNRGHGLFADGLVAVGVPSVFFIIKHLHNRRFSVVSLRYRSRSEYYRTKPPSMTRCYRNCSQYYRTKHPSMTPCYRNRSQHYRKDLHA